MPDNKLTDNKIIKALECCNKNDCRECPYCKYNTPEWCCMPKVRKDAIDLINRQKAENERLQLLFESVINSRDGYIKVIEQYKAENERLKGIKTTDWLIKGISAEQLEKEKIEALEDNAYRLGKAEAYKEVEDKITELFLRYAFLHSHVDCARKDYIKADDETEIEMQSVWDVFTLQKYGIANYETMNRLQTNIELIEKGRLLAELEKDFKLLVKELVGEDK